MYATLKNQMVLTAFAGAFLMGGLLPTEIRAEIVAQDDFAVGGSGYTAGGLAGQSATAVGFAGAWASNDLTVSGSTNLGIPGYASAAGTGSLSYGGTVLTQAVRPFTGAASSALLGANSIWFSALVTNDNAGGTVSVGFALPDGGMVTVGQRLGGFHLYAWDGVADGAWPNWSNLGEVFNNEGFALNTPNLVIGQIIMDLTPGADETLNLWAVTNINDVNLATPLMTTAADVFKPGVTITGALITSNNAGTSVDSLRYATDFQSLVEGVPVPEPSSVGMMIMGSLALGLVRRKRTRID